MTRKPPHDSDNRDDRDDMTRAMRHRRRNESGFAMMTAIWLTVIAVMLVTAYTTLIQSWVSAVANENYEMTASSAAMTGVQRALAELIRDTPAATAYANQGVIITEVLLHGKKVGGSDTLMISKVFMGPNTGVATNDNDYVELFNPTSATVDLSSLNIVRSAATNMHSLTGTIEPYSYKLIGGRLFDNRIFAIQTDTADRAAGEASFSVAGNGIGANSNVCLRYGSAATGRTLDTAGWGTSPLFNGTVLGALGANQAFVRKTDAVTGLPQNTGDNLNDFDLVTIGNDTHGRSSATAAIVPTFNAAADRRYEFIEIQNTDSYTHNLETQDYWISVASVTGGFANKRYIHPFPSTAAVDTLGAYDVGVVVAVDADTPYIAGLSGKTTADIRWFGLGALAAPSIDTFLAGPMPGRGLSDRDDSVVLGYGGVATVFWTGLDFLNWSNNSSADTSWQKLTDAQGDTTDPYSANLSADWETSAATPGVALYTSGGGVDGSSDTWYRMAYDSFVLAMPNAYYRVRVYDEGAKVNINACTTTKYRSANPALQDSLVFSDRKVFVGDSIVYNLLEDASQANPPFASAPAWSAAQVTEFVGKLRGSWNPESGTSASLLTPEAAYMLITSQSGGLSVARYLLPYMTVYGYAETDAWKINVNTADLPPLRAGMITALWRRTTPAAAITIADKVYNYVTNPASPATFDSNPYNDARFNTVDQVINQTSGLTAAEKAAMTSCIDTFRQVFRVASSGYFTIQATGFLFKKGANPVTDTPVARSQVVAVMRRESNRRKGTVIFWREVLEDQKTLFPVSTTSRRHPSHPWDPVYQ
jgi:hypothetical protein